MDSRTQGSRPRTQAQVFSKKKVLKFFFRRSLKIKKDLRKFSARFLAFSNKILTIEKIVLYSADDRAIFEDLRLRGQRLQNQRWSRGHKARGQGHKKIRGQGQGQTLSRPRTQAQVLCKKKGLHKNFSGDLQKKIHKNFSSDLHKKTFSKQFFKRSTKF